MVVTIKSFSQIGSLILDKYQYSICFFKLDILGIILCTTLAINVVWERSCKRYDACQSLQPAFLIVTNFCTATLVLKFQPFGQDSSLKHFLLFGQAVSSTAVVVCCCHLMLNVWWDDCYWGRLHQKIEMKMFMPIGSCTVGTKHFTYQCIDSTQTCIEFANK